MRTKDSNLSTIVRCSHRLGSAARDFILAKMVERIGNEAARERRRNQLIRELLEDACHDVARRQAVPSTLGGSDSISWRRIQNVAHNLGARAAALDLGVLQMCAQELEQFATVMLEDTSDGKDRALEAAMVAIETISLELEALRNATHEKPAT